VLDGGLARWRADHRATVGGDESRPAAQFVPHQRSDMTVDANQVRDRLGRADWRLVDARSPERFRGEVEPVDPVAGHIPGAIDHFYKSDVTPEHIFQPSEVLKRRLEETLGGVPSDRTMCYCGSGVTACHILLALEHAGMPGARLYPGSWSEWVSDPLRPVARGDGS
jgi:thiosulfate/3-mercaptopyruvate sulfurtransferase